MPTSFRDMKRDDRPQKGAWAPGNYFCLCVGCGGQFLGDKRAVICADCAYSEVVKPQEPVHHICAWIMNQFSKRWASVPGKQ